MVVQILLAYWLSRVTERHKRDLSKEIEDYKKVISKELEAYRIQLQAEFQTKFHEFQTRYSLLHQKRAEAIETLFALLAKVQNDLQVWAAWENLSRKETKLEWLRPSIASLLTMLITRGRSFFWPSISNPVTGRA